MEAVLPKRRLFVSFLLILSLFLTLIPVQAQAAAAKTVKLPKTASVLVGKKVTLKTTFSPAGTKSKIKWTSSNKTVATVSAKGVVTGRKAGTAKIKATLPNKKSATCKVTVKKPVFTVKSAGIASGVIADEYGMRGPMKNYVPTVSLPLSISGAPSGTKAYAILMNDPDCSPAWVHWTAFTSKATLAKNASAVGTGLVQGKNDFGTIGYGGPTPPVKHTYVITVYALDSTVALSRGFSLAEFQSAVAGHTLAKATIKGTYAP